MGELKVHTLRHRQLCIFDQVEHSCFILIGLFDRYQIGLQALNVLLIYFLILTLTLQVFPFLVIVIYKRIVYPILF